MHQELFYVPGTTVTDKELFLFTRNYFNVPGTRTTFVFLSYKWAPQTEWNHWCVLYLGSVALEPRARACNNLCTCFSDLFLICTVNYWHTLIYVHVQ